MSLVHEIEWNKVFEFTWRILVFVVAIAIIVIVSTNWTRWEGGEGWQRTTDAYLQSDLTPISAMVSSYIRELLVRDYERVRSRHELPRLVVDDCRAAVATAEANILGATAQHG